MAIDKLPKYGNVANVEVVLTAQVEEVIKGLAAGKTKDLGRLKKVRKTIKFLADDPSHRSLATHRYEDFDALFDEKIWESYVENHTPGAWRIWWFYGPGDNEITVVDVGPHP